MKKIGIVVVDDSTFVQKALVRVLSDVPDFTIVGAVGTGEDLLANMGKWKPDVIILDLLMPGMGGLETLTRIMEATPTRVIIMSSHSQKDAPITIEALHRGAIDFIDKQQYSLADFGSLRGVLVEKIRSVVGGNVKAIITKQEQPAPSSPPVKEKPAPAKTGLSEFDLVLIGASTGGPPAIQDLLTDMGVVPVPTVIVQHMPAGFTKPFAERLNNHMLMTVREAQHAEFLQPSTVYIAPAGQHLRLKYENGRPMAVMTTYPENLPHRPAVDILFESAVPFAKRVLAVILTGMGSDGAEGMAALARGGAYTIAQDERSCVVFGMPKAAIDRNCVREVLPLNAIGRRLRDMVTGFARA